MGVVPSYVHGLNSSAIDERFACRMIMGVLRFRSESRLSTAVSFCHFNKQKKKQHLTAEAAPSSVRKMSAAIRKTKQKCNIYHFFFSCLLILSISGLTKRPNDRRKERTKNMPWVYVAIFTTSRLSCAINLFLCAVQVVAFFSKACCESTSRWFIARLIVSETLDCWLAIASGSCTLSSLACL